MGASDLSRSGLVSRLQDIPGVAAVAVDLTETGGGINMRLESGADEIEVMERVRALLVAYGVRSHDSPRLRVGRAARRLDDEPLGVDITITPLERGARVEVATTNIRSFRVVRATPSALAQGLSDAWCQVIGRIPVEVVSVDVGEGGDLTVTVTNGEAQTTGTANVSDGWEEALSRAVGQAIGVLGQHAEAIAVNS